MNEKFSNSTVNLSVSKADEYAFVAPRYEMLFGNALLPLRRNIRTFIRYNNHKRIIDICCGTGKLLEMLIDKDMELTGVDTSTAMLKELKRHDSIRVVRKNAAEIDLPEKSFDAVILSFALHEKEEFERAVILKNSWSLVRDEGHLIIADYCSAHFGVSGLIFKKLFLPIIEFAAGKSHFKNYRSWLRNGALEGHIQALSTHEEIIGYHFYGTVLVCAVKKENRSRKIFEAINMLHG